MKIITTIEATTDAEQEEVARLLAMLTGVSVTTTKAKVADPVLPSTTEQLRHQIRATVHRLVQEGYNHQVRLALQSFNDAEKISEVDDAFLPEFLEKLHAIDEEVM